jgi:hypothetical protein
MIIHYGERTTLPISIVVITIIISASCSLYDAILFFTGKRAFNEARNQALNRIPVDERDKGVDLQAAARKERKK